MSPAGRRKGDSGTREAILSAAKQSFAEQGYAGTSLRALARTAAVDPALITHFFGSKDGLFEAALALPLDPRPIRSAVPWREAGALVRLNIGLEDPVDLIDDLQAGLAGLKNP